MRTFWNAVVPKVKAAAAVAATLNGASLVIWLNGSATWREALAAIIVTDTPVVAAWLRRDKPAA